MDFSNLNSDFSCTSALQGLQKTENNSPFEQAFEVLKIQLCSSGCLVDSVDEKQMALEQYQKTLPADFVTSLLLPRMKFDHPPSGLTSADETALNNRLAVLNEKSQHIDDLLAQCVAENYDNKDSIASLDIKALPDFGEVRTNLKKVSNDLKLLRRKVEEKKLRQDGISIDINTFKKSKAGLRQKQDIATKLQAQVQVNREMEASVKQLREETQKTCSEIEARQTQLNEMSSQLTKMTSELGELKILKPNELADITNTIFTSYRKNKSWQAETEESLKKISAELLAIRKRQGDATEEDKFTPL